jgi:polyhydroxyalkanoate synthesis regulator phasin
MPKKGKTESQAEQSERFKRDAQRLVDAGELNPTEADKALDSIVRKASLRRHD